MRRNHSSKTGQRKWAEMGVFGRPRFGIPLVFLVTRGIAYWDLKKKGTTWWDFNNGSEVSYVQWGFVRGLACAMVIVLLAAVYLAAYWQYLFP